MRLQSDPTIIYGLVGGKGSLGRPILRSEIDRPTPYNTYAIEGLPPGPIANPGRDAIAAVLQPDGGTVTFAGLTGAVLATPGTRTITVRDVANPALTGTDERVAAAVARLTTD